MGLSINDALFNLSYWKIAGLRPAIFSGTPGNFKAEYSGLCLSFQAIENPLLQNYANFECIAPRAIKYHVERFKFYEKARQMKKAFCSDNCAGYFLRKKFDPRLILVFPKLPQ